MTWTLDYNRDTNVAIWEYRNDAGEIVNTLRWNNSANRHEDGAGNPLPREFNKAKEAIESGVVKTERQGRLQL